MATCSLLLNPVPPKRNTLALHYTLEIRSRSIWAPGGISAEEVGGTKNQFLCSYMSRSS